MSEPRLEDDVAAGRNEVCEACDKVECVCSSYDTLEELFGDA